MVELESIFRHKSPNGEKLISNGFAYSKRGYSKTFAVLCGQFHVRVYEAESGEEYVLVHVPGAAGSFVGKVRGACEEVLAGVSAGCFDTYCSRRGRRRPLWASCRNTAARSQNFCGRSTRITLRSA